MNLIYFTILIPLISFLILAFIGRRLDRGNLAVIGISAIGLVCLLSVFITIDFYNNIQPDSMLVYTRYLWRWFSVNDFSIAISLLLDGLSLTFLLIVAFIGFLVYLFAIGYMSKNESYIFFAYGNLLIASMLVLILADNLFVMLIGWEGVSLCSYLLIGFHHKQLKSSYAAVRTFIVMHIGDIFLLIGLFLIYGELHTLNIKAVIALATDRLAIDSEIIYWITLMLFLGAIGKSAQLPLHIWLTDSSSAPMPALTLIHSASVMLAGVYLVMRLNGLFVMSNDVLWIIGIVASLTLIFSACSALVQNDIKRVIAYASLSQICYVFLAISVQAWNEGLIYLINYTVFSALLFLASASMIQACDGERNIQKMGAKIRAYPFIYFCFVMAGASFSVVPWLTASFYTKGDILWATFMKGRLGFSAIGLVGILLSTLFVFRLIFILFHNRHRQTSPKTTKVSRAIYVPLSILVILSLGVFNSFSLPTEGFLPVSVLNQDGLFSFQLLLAAVTILGILTTYILYAGKNNEITEIAGSPLGKALTQLWYSGWRTEWIYHVLFVAPYLFAAKMVQKDPINVWLSVIPQIIRKMNIRIAKLENGHLRWYITSIVAGALFILLLLVFV
ncbi:NADH-quinone oxidoreductase subunit L [Utexia brackfieldae]|uniref:NADH-quinone oxidoreductase subunit L n=1 Tax=Utexia brackfieldae TaxID=3074108 RepID=UPI00370DAC74